MTVTGHGPNIGHGFVKYIIIDEQGVEREPVVCPAMIANAGKSVAGAVAQASTVEFGGKHWWVGDDALLSTAPITMLTQDRLMNSVSRSAASKSDPPSFAERLRRSVGVPRAS